MTLPDERYRAILNARHFLRSLLDRSATPRVPVMIRKQAYAVLKHFPSDLDLERSSQVLPEVWGRINKRRASELGAKKKGKSNGIK